MGRKVGEKYAMWHERRKVTFGVVADQVRTVAFPEA